MTNDIRNRILKNILPRLWAKKVSKRKIPKIAQEHNIPLLTHIYTLRPLHEA